MRELTKILNLWIILTFVMLLLTSTLAFPAKGEIRLTVLLLNIVSAMSFYFIIKQSIENKNYSWYNSKRLSIILLWYSLAFVTLYNLFYYYETQSFFEFSARDTLQYDELARWMIRDGNLIGSIWDYITVGYRIDDLGAVVITSFAYLFYPSPLMFNVLNLIAGLITATSIFRISLFYMDRKYAYLTALSYGLSSFVIYLYSTGMKETFFVMIIVLSFERLRVFIEKRSFLQLFYALTLLSTIMFFRPVVMVMILFSVFTGFTLSKKKHYYIYIIIIFFIAGFIFLGPNALEIANSVSTNSEDVALSQQLTPNLFNYSNAVLASVAGPLPSYLPIIEREQQAFYSTGLGFRMLLTLFFILGLFLIMRERDIFLVTISLFTIVEMISLATILESFELRFSTPHYPLVYIISFYYLYRYGQNSVAKRDNKIHFAFKLGVAILLLGWNLRY
jgi:hypothetical protein